MALKKTVLIVAAITVATVAIGYLSARASLPKIEAEIRQEVIAKKITGYAFGGDKIPPERITVTAWVEYPFVATGSYSVPHDLHASYHSTKYLVLPWSRSILSKDSFTSM
jgi:hypothetical protein